MRWFVVAMVWLSAATAAVDAAVAQTSPGLARTIGRDNPQNYSPISNGFDHQPTQYELRASHEQDVTGKQAREIDRLYDELLSTGPKTPKRRHTQAH